MEIICKKSHNLTHEKVAKFKNAKIHHVVLNVASVSIKTHFGQTEDL